MIRFLERYKLSKLTQEFDNPNISVSSKQFVFVVKPFSGKKTQAQIASWVYMTKHLIKK